MISSSGGDLYIGTTRGETADISCHSHQPPKTNQRLVGQMRITKQKFFVYHSFFYTETNAVGT